mgnify:FL=1|jgi:hypothetical protein|tara:strand:+ start:559 stop:717 length:159 start_codon:yes stop_codon:yes gene_type:complete
MKRLLKTVHVEYFEELEGDERFIRVETKTEKHFCSDLLPTHRPTKSTKVEYI